MVSAVVSSMAGPSTTTPWTTITRGTARSSRNRIHGQGADDFPGAYKHMLGQRSSTRATTWTTARTCCACSSPCRQRTTRWTQVHGRQSARPAAHSARDHRAERQHLDRAPRACTGTNPYAGRSRPRCRPIWCRPTAAPNEAGCWPCSRTSPRSTTSRSCLERRERAQGRTHGLMGFGHRVYKNSPRGKDHPAKCAQRCVRPCSRPDRHRLFDLACASRRLR